MAQAFHTENKPVVLRRAGRPRKTPFADLPEDWKEKFSSGKDEDIRSESSSVALAEVANQASKKLDEDLAEKLAAAKAAGEQYSEASKLNKLKLTYLRQLLEARGKEDDISLRASAG